MFGSDPDAKRADRDRIPRTDRVAAWARAAERWTAIGCPYEAALALADADAEEPRRHALAELERLGVEAAAARVKSRLHSTR